MKNWKILISIKFHERYSNWFIFYELGGKEWGSLGMLVKRKSSKAWRKFQYIPRLFWEANAEQFLLCYQVFSKFSRNHLIWGRVRELRQLRFIIIFINQIYGEINSIWCLWPKKWFISMNSTFSHLKLPHQPQLKQRGKKFRKLHFPYQQRFYKITTIKFRASFYFFRVRKWKIMEEE